MSTASPFSRLRFPAIALAAVLSACGGGGGSTPPPAQPKAPVALADTVSATSNQETTFKVLANDSHPDNLALELVSVGAAAHGTAALKNGALVYTPAAKLLRPGQDQLYGGAPWVAR
ncbi:Ig-like domain-containing protein [Massilia sp. H-1]|nr:Ig-like domain-containing protein [Massilia sp. H-1]